MVRRELRKRSPKVTITYWCVGHQSRRPASGSNRKARLCAECVAHRIAEAEANVRKYLGLDYEWLIAELARPSR